MHNATTKKRLTKKKILGVVHEFARLTYIHAQSIHTFMHNATKKKNLGVVHEFARLEARVGHLGLELLANEMNEHTMSHHHTYYVTSSYILCHIIIPGK